MLDLPQHLLERIRWCNAQAATSAGRWVPTWAQKALQAGTRDPRPYLHTWEELSRGQTHDPWWNAAQQSLVRHGGLHNNLRMTWGKAILNWTRSPQQALRMLIDLNHRFALDGRDPASYGGILWCLGQFDRPFQPPQPILGTVRPRPTAGHAQRLDVKSMLDHVSQRWKRFGGPAAWRNRSRRRLIITAGATRCPPRLEPQVATRTPRSGWSYAETGPPALVSRGPSSVVALQPAVF